MDRKYEGYYTKMDEKMNNMNARFEAQFQSMNTNLDSKYPEYYTRLEEKIDNMDARYEAQFQTMNTNFNNFQLENARQLSTLGHTMEDMFNYIKMVCHLYAFNCRVGNMFYEIV